MWYSSAKRRATGEIKMRPRSAAVCVLCSAGGAAVALVAVLIEGEPAVGETEGRKSLFSSTPLLPTGFVPATEPTCPGPSTLSGNGSSAEPTSAMLEPMGAELPSGTRILRSTPLVKASISILTLSVSTSARGSPLLTGSPSFLSQRRILPSSIVSPILGISTVFIYLNSLAAHEGRRYNSFHRFDNIILLRQRGSLQHFGIGHRDISAGNMLNGSIHVIEGVFVNQRGQPLTGPVVFPALFSNNNPVSLFHRVNNQINIDGTDASQVDDFGLNALFSEVFSSLQGDVEHARERHDSDILTGAFHIALIERHSILNILFRYLTLHIVEQFVLDEQHRIGIAHRRFKHTFDIVWGRGHNHLQTGNVGVPGLEHLRVLCAALCAAAAGRTDHQGNLWLAAEHIAKLGGTIHDQVAGEQTKVNRHDFEDWSQALESGADGEAGNHLFRQGSIAYTLFAELIDQSFGHGVGSAVARDIFAQDKNALVASHFIADRLPQRLTVRYYAHKSLLPLVAIGEGGRVIDHNIGVKLIQRGIGAVGRELGGILGYLDRSGIIFIEFGLRSHIMFQQQAFEDADGVARMTPLLFFFAGAIIGRVGHRVPTEAVRFDLQQRRSFPVAGAFDRAARCLIDGDYLHAIHLFAGDIMSGGARDQAIDRPGFLDRHAH